MYTKVLKHNRLYTLCLYLIVVTLKPERLCQTTLLLINLIYPIMEANRKKIYANIMEKLGSLKIIKDQMHKQNSLLKQHTISLPLQHFFQTSKEIQFDVAWEWYVRHQTKSLHVCYRNPRFFSRFSGLGSKYLEIKPRFHQASILFTYLIVYSS